MSFKNIEFKECNEPEVSLAEKKKVVITPTDTHENPELCKRCWNANVNDKSKTLMCLVFRVECSTLPNVVRCEHFNPGYIQD